MRQIQKIIHKLLNFISLTIIPTQKQRGKASCKMNYQNEVKFWKTQREKGDFCLHKTINLNIHYW